MSSEQTLLNTIQKVLPASQAWINEDAFYDPATRTVYTTDLLVEGTHFDWAYFSPQNLGWKAAAVNLSDLAAMGAAPQYLLVSLGLPKSVSETEVQAFYQGLQEIAEQVGVKVVGGDTVCAPQWVVNIAATGTLPATCTPGFRHTASVGDIVYTTGHPGLSACGLVAFQQKYSGFEAAKQQHLRPVPRLREAATLAKTLTQYSMMDTSDGLADAAIKIARASQVMVCIEAKNLPLHPDVLACCEKENKNPIEVALYGGEDFELLVSAPPDCILPEAFIPIGTVIEKPILDSPAAVLFDQDGQQTPLQLEHTYAHFDD